MFLLKRCILHYRQTRKHDQIITWLQLNHASLFVRYLGNSVKCYLSWNTPWMLSFLFQQHSALAHQRMVRRACSCCTATLHFSYSYGPSSPDVNSVIYSATFMQSYCVGCKSAVLKKSTSHWLNSGKPLTLHSKNAIFAFPCFPR